MNEKFELAKQKYQFYLHWKNSGMLSGKYGDKDAMKRMQEIRSLLSEIGLTLKDLKNSLDNKNF